MSSFTITWDMLAAHAERALMGDIQEPDEFDKYVRKVRAASPHFDLNPAAAFAHFGFQQWKRAAAANRRADDAEKLLGILADATK